MSIAEIYLTQYTQEFAMDITTHYAFLKTRSRQELIELCVSTHSDYGRVEFASNITSRGEIDKAYKNMYKNFNIMDVTALVHYLCKRETTKKANGRIEYGSSIFGDNIKMFLEKQRSDEVKCLIEKKKQMDAQRLATYELAKKEFEKEKEILDALYQLEKEKTKKMLEIMAEAASMEW